MTHLWLVANSASGSTDERAIEEVRREMERLGYDTARMIDLAKETLPEADCAPGLIASLGGDGTANAVIDRYGEQEDTALLILPGGTMNLLARRLHGEVEIPEILEKAARGGEIVTLPRIEGPDFHSLVGVIAGPTAHWGKVREDWRERDLSTLIESVPAALEETFEGNRIRINGHADGHAALFIEPSEDMLHAHAIRAETLGDLALHGWAWLNRDFLGGPTEELMRDRQVVLEQEGGLITILADGEGFSSSPPLHLRWGRCPARFLATTGG